MTLPLPTFSPPSDHLSKFLVVLGVSFVVTAVVILGFFIWSDRNALVELDSLVGKLDQMNIHIQTNGKEMDAVVATLKKSNDVGQPLDKKEVDHFNPLLAEHNEEMGRFNSEN